MRNSVQSVIRGVRLRRVSALALVALLLAVTPAFGANGSLKVTSFPSGAQVWVDGANSGKVTPMSISLPEGDHSVTVSLPNSGWNPDTRTVTIVEGNNDLSVTLLPALTTGAAGPQGPQGPQGAQGPRGEQGLPGLPGAAAVVRLASPGECPTGGIVVTSGDGAVSLPVCNGAVGPQGLQGVQGIQGVEGPAGPQGSAVGVPAIDPTTLVGYGDNLRVVFDQNIEPCTLGLSPIYVNSDVRLDTERNSVRYVPGKWQLAPFAIATSSNFIGPDGTPLPGCPSRLTNWFNQAREDDPGAARTLRVELLKSGDVKFSLTLFGCVPTSLDTDYAGSVRVIVTCIGVSSLSVTGGTFDPAFPTDSIHLPRVPHLPFMSLSIFGARQLVTDVSGGGKRLLRISGTEYLSADPLRVRTGSVQSTAFDVDAVTAWVRDALESVANKFQNIELLDGEGDAIASYSEVFLSSIGLFDPARTLGSAHTSELPTIRIGFDLVMQPALP